MLVVGRITRAHGLRGELVVDVLSSEADARLAVGSVLATDGGPLVVESARPHQGKWLVFFDGVHTREAADALRGTELRGEPIDDPDALWVHDLVGAEVVDAGGTARGTVVAVLANPADDLLELEGGALVPVGFVTGRDADGRVVVDVPDGLFDLYDD